MKSRLKDEFSQNHRPAIGLGGSESPLHESMGGPAIIEKGIDFWDGLILAIAATAKSKELLSEDLSHQQKLQVINIRNPFL